MAPNELWALEKGQKNGRGCRCRTVRDTIPPLLMSFVLAVWLSRKQLSGWASDITLAFVKPLACACLSSASSERVTCILR